MEPTITLERRGHVLLIGFNRPQKKNAFTLEMLAALAQAYSELDSDGELRCGVVFAHGKDFTAGLDLANVAPAIAAGQPLAPTGGVDPWATHGARCRKPIIVAVHGLCLTLGIELLLAADICIAAAGTRFGQIEIKRGIFPFGGGTFRWVERVGWGNAMRYLLTGDELDAAEALRTGLIQGVVAPEALLDSAVELAQRIAAQAPLGVQATLHNAHISVTDGEAAAVTALMPKLRELMGSEDAAEGLASFVERRQAQFKGK